MILEVVRAVADLDALSESKRSAKGSIEVYSLSNYSTVSRYFQKGISIATPSRAVPSAMMQVALHTTPVTCFPKSLNPHAPIRTYPKYALLD